MQHKLGYTGGYADFMRLYLQGHAGFCRGHDCLVLPTWNHRWFVAYLWVYTLVGWAWPRGPGCWWRLTSNATVCRPRPRPCAGCSGSSAAPCSGGAWWRYWAGPVTCWTVTTAGVQASPGPCSYILHQTLVIGLAVALRPLKLHAAVEGPLIIAATFGLCGLAYAVAWHVPGLRQALGIAPPARVQPGI